MVARSRYAGFRSGAGERGAARNVAGVIMDLTSHTMWVAPTFRRASRSEPIRLEAGSLEAIGM
jgi:hypothetical protein